MSQQIEEYVRGLGLDAYVVGGAVRDELLGIESKDADFLVLGVDHEGLRALLEPHGRVEDLEVAGQRVGLRLRPRDRAIRELAPAGIEFAPPRREASTGPGRHDFEIVVDPSASVQDDLERRDFTVNAMARRLSDGELVDPFGGQEDLEDRVLRTVSPRSLSEDPLRVLRGLRLVSQFDLAPDDETARQLVEEGESVKLVSAERIGGGLQADGMGELSKLLLGSRPAKALRLARDTGVLLAIIPEFAPAIGYGADNVRQGGPVDEHTFSVVANTPRSLPVRLAALLHDLGKPHVRVEEHAAEGARIADRVLERLRYPTRVRRYVVDLIAAHAFFTDDVGELFARRFLREHGEQLARDLVAHKEADLRAKKNVDANEIARTLRLRELIGREASQPHLLRDLAVDGTDLIELGYGEGPVLGATLDELLDLVVDDPSRNERNWLLSRAKERLA
ncbi:MAG: CCA tRNA nucleotidyltransferase [Gaiellaceae bacterium]